MKLENLPVRLAAFFGTDDLGLPEAEQNASARVPVGGHKNGSALKICILRTRLIGFAEALPPHHSEPNLQKTQLAALSLSNHKGDGSPQACCVGRPNFVVSYD